LQTVVTVYSLRQRAVKANRSNGTNHIVRTSG
jgi:hypothetical protein